ncbi:extracellular solute-binding protein [Virgibacillus sp. JSM 102003]|uniref:ABC transporter substrate-binding protein n=1 Tax=Virgibacillus sp. JSM 102003 TaxID=1562108 RepID=UPI0035C25751
MKKIISLTILIVVALIAAGCNDNSESSSDNNDEPVSIYTHNDSEEMQAFVKGMTEETGIEAEVLRLSSGEAWSRMKSEAPDFGADMQWGMLHSFAIKAKKNDYLASYKSPTWKDIPDKFKDPDGKWYGWSYWFNMLAVNKEIIKEKGLDVPQSWEDLLDPQYKGEIVLPDPGTSGTAYLFTSTILQIMGEEKGWEYLEKLDKNVGQYTKSGSAPAQLVAQGEYAIGITWDQAVYERIEQGYPIEAVIPEEGVGYSLDVVWMFKNAKNKEKVKKIIDYIGTTDAMKIAAEHRSMVTNPDIEAGVKNIEKHLIDYDAVWAAENRDRIMQQWKENFN